MTYANTEQPALLHTLQMYRTLLDKPELFNEQEETNVKKTTKTHSKHDIDEVFIEIRRLYSENEFIIIYQTLLMLEKHPENYETYIQGLNLILIPVTEQIQKWINDNIVY